MSTASRWSGPPRARGASWNPKNRFEALAIEPEPPDEHEEPRPVVTQFLRDPSREILAWNDSPDVGFDVGINPYRGCEHGCIYCFARPTHEYLGFSAGLDFETKILVKEDAPELLRQALTSPKWKPQPIAMSGVVDPYQPIERKLQLTRRCLEVFRDFRNPVCIITKSQLVARDVDLLAELAHFNCVIVNISLTSLRPELQRIMEPRAAAPSGRLHAIEVLSKAGVRVNVLVGPVIPALNEEELPAIIEAAAKAGAKSAGHILLRLPWAVAPLFERWLEEHFPERKEKVLNRLRAMRGGKLYDSTWFKRGRGEGIYADQIEALFNLGCQRAGFTNERVPLSTEHFRRPGAEQLALF